MGELERLGDSDAFAEQLLDLIESHGWIVQRRRAFAGEDVMLIATLGKLEQRASGPRTASAALALFDCVVPYFGTAYEREAAELRGDEQLRLLA